METALQLQPVNRLSPNRLVPNLNPSLSRTIEAEIVDVAEEVITPQFTSRLPFIEANTKEVSIQHLKEDCVVPVFSKDNEITISHASFIEAVWNAASKVFPRENIEKPSIRVSHVIKGRTPEAIHKNVRELLDEDKTIYYERMMFCFEVPTIHEDISGNRLNLTIGGVRAYNHENLYSRKVQNLHRFQKYGMLQYVCQYRWFQIGIKGYGCAWIVQCCNTASPRIQCSQTALLYRSFQG